MKHYFGVEYGNRGFAGESDEIVGVWVTRAYDAEHAVERFYETGDEDGFVVFRVCVVQDEHGQNIPGHRRRWVAL